MLVVNRLGEVRSWGVSAGIYEGSLMDGFLYLDAELSLIRFQQDQGGWACWVVLNRLENFISE